MTKFVICDTDPKFLDELAGMLHRLFDPCAVEFLYGPNALEVALRADYRADILITEIELGGRKATDIIANCLEDVRVSPPQIIYVTTGMDYCSEAYDTPHCGYILKPVSPEQIRKSVERALTREERRRKMKIAIQANGKIRVVDTNQIYYVEGKGRKVRLVTKGGSLETYEKLSDILFRLNKSFVQSHKSYITNMDYVKEYCGTSILMSNGDLIPVSQSRRKEVRQTLLEYFGGGGEDPES